MAYYLLWLYLLRQVLRPLWHEFPRDTHVRAGAWWAPEPPAGSVAAAAAAAGDEAAAAEEEEDTDGGAGSTEGETGAAVAAADGGGGGGECACYKCDAVPCHAPHCSSCGPKATRQL
jgi:hypothetical protein